MKKLLLFLPLLLFAASVEQLFNVTTTKVKKITTAITQDFYGYVKLDEKYIYDIAPRFSGFVEKLYIKENYTPVKKGQKLLLAYSPEVLKAKEEYLSSLRFGDRKMTRAAYLKLKLLGLPANELKNPAATRYHTAIISPIDGIVIKKNIFAGSAFKKAQTIFTIAYLHRVQIFAKASQKELPFIQKAQDVHVIVDGKSLPAHNLTILPKTKNGLITMRADFTSPIILPAGSYAKLRLSLAPRSYLVLPRSAIIKKSGRWIVFVKGEFEGEFEPKVIEATPLDERYYIVHGLKEGTEVANSAMFLLDSDAQINGLYND